MRKRSISTIAVALFSLVALAAPVPQAAGAQRVVPDGQALPVALRALTFQSVFAGVSVDGESSVWEGRADGVATGPVKLELKQVGLPGEAANPVWHVRGRWTLDASDTKSFVADLEGVVDWKSARIRLTGTITSGWRSGARLEQEGQIVNGDISGRLTIVR